MKKVLILLLMFLVFGCSKKLIKQEIVKPEINPYQVQSVRIIKEAEELQKDRYANVYLLLAKISYEKKQYLNAVNFAEASIEIANLTVEPKESTLEIGYIVKKGDSLWSIAYKIYKDPFKWKSICKKNNLKNGNLIYPFQKLIIPVEVKQ